MTLSQICSQTDFSHKYLLKKVREQTNKSTSELGNPPNLQIKCQKNLDTNSRKNQITWKVPNGKKDTKKNQNHERDIRHQGNAVNHYTFPGFAADNPTPTSTLQDQG